MPSPSTERLERLNGAAARRMGGVAVVLEHIEDLGNRAAILRTIEALGFLRVHEVGAPPSHASGTARSIMNGGEKYLEINRWPDFASCAAGLRAAGVERILAALPPDERVDHREEAVDEHGVNQFSSKARGQALHSQRLDEVDFSRDTALVFGNERLGVSAEAISLATGAFHVPMFGLSESFNVSVTVAIVLAGARGQRARALNLGLDDGDLEVGARDALAAHYASLGGNFSKHERTKRTLDHEAAAAPPTLESFAAPAQAVYEAARLGHETMAYGELSLHVWLICQVFGVATRARTLRTARWGHEIVRLPGDSEPEPEPEPEQKEEGQQQQGLVWNCCDWRICVDDTVQPSAVPVFVQLSHLQPLASEPVCLLQPTLVSQALGWLFARTESPDDGRLVFSHSASEEEVFKKTKFCKFFTAKVGAEMDCAMLRGRLKIDADELLGRGAIDASSRALLARLLGEES